MFSDAVLHAAKVDAERCYPNESCGLVVNGEYQSKQNLSATPLVAFKMQKGIAATKGLQAIIHSHPDGPACPSESDMIGQRDTDIPWGIITVDGGVAGNPFWWGDDVEIPLLERPFRHGVTDCYSIIRDYYRQEKDIILKDYPRQWEWWLNGKDDFYSAYFADEGFRVIDDSEVREGDIFLAQVRSRVPNHGGVYLGGGLIIHQLGGKLPYDPSRLSCKEPWHRWRKHITHWLRHD